MADLCVETGPFKGTHCHFSDNEAFVVGSDTGCHLKLSGPGIAARHLVIKALKKGGFGVKKLGGGFLLNGREAEAGRLREGDILDVGATRLRFGPPRQDKQDKGAGTLGGFRLFEVLGKGGMGTVYRAEQVSLHRQVALKVLKKELTKDPVFVARFVAEARAAARLSHPNVVQVIDVGHDGDTYYLSMELMHDGSLEERLRSSGAIPVTEALQMVADAAEGLAYAESLRIVHCDIKPDNLMLDHHGTVKIADLGLAMTDEDNLTKLVGTPHFMPPEQVRREPMDHRSDLYALGCTFYRLLTGKTPFRGATVKDILRAQLKETPEPPHKLNPDVPVAVSDIVLKLLEKSPAERYQSASALLEDIHHVQSPPARKGLLIAGAAVLVLAAGAAIVWAVNRDPEKIIIRENGQPDPETLRRLREANAERAYLKVLINRSLTPAEVVRRLREVVKEYSGTKASGQATKIADGIETEERNKAAEIARQQQLVNSTLARLRAHVNPLFAKDDFRAIADALNKPDVDPELGATPEVKRALKGMRNQLHTKADAKLAKLKSETEAALKNKDPDAIIASLPPLEAAVDRKKGWPRDVLRDRRGLEQFIRKHKAAAAALRIELAAAAERTAWQTYVHGCVGKDGVLERVQRFDLAGAETLAVKMANQLKGQPPGERSARLLDLVQAASRYLSEYQKAIAGGAIHVPLGDAGAKAKVTGLTLGTEGKLILEVVKDGARTSREHSLAEVCGDRAFQVFHAGTARGCAHERAALLTLLLIVEHAAEARAYLSRLDPKQDTSGTGGQSYNKNSLRLRELRTALGKPGHEWEHYLADELLALGLMVDGFRALSERRNQAASTHTDRLLTHHPRSLVVMLLN